MKLKTKDVESYEIKRKRMLSPMKLKMDDIESYKLKMEDVESYETKKEDVESFETKKRGR